jgi:predicted nucleic acid-binding protein
MILVVADTSPLNYLIQINCHELLPALYGQVLIPAAVFEELQHPATPAAVLGWAQQLPPWIDVREVSSEPDSTLNGLGPGEREAIQLAERERADLLLIDERLGVRLAQQHGLTVTGTLGILIQAAVRRLVDMEEVIAQLQKTTFRCTPEMYERARQRAREEMGKSTYPRT